ncbi:hypothetical protein QAD02_015353 [Eretmocerus hayati]|uniref:Uncharacterized protein n=1 Tax=Eretmocerus hayati TaxID=131215 RepID=A0ACC2P808_9HYME|nr:hypothetical protein QAD02_015353 [Eretmocerus hayati]
MFAGGRRRERPSKQNIHAKRTFHSHMGLSGSRPAPEIDPVPSAPQQLMLQREPSRIKGQPYNLNLSNSSHHTRSGSVRGAPRQPMPDPLELERRFTKVLVSRR